jgi:phenylalanine-4-hydroxylase
MLSKLSRVAVRSESSLRRRCVIPALQIPRRWSTATPDVVYSLYQMEDHSRRHPHTVSLQQQQPTVQHSDSESPNLSNVSNDRAAAKGIPRFESQARNLSDTTTPTNDQSADGIQLLYGEVPRTSVLLALTDRVGALHDVLRYFWKHNVNICRIESRPVYSRNRDVNSSAGATAQQRRFDFFVDFEGSSHDANVRQLLDDLRGLTDQLLLLDAKSVHWFPRHISELDRIAHRTLDAGIDLEAADHPGFHDAVYRARRGDLARLSSEHQWDQPIAHIDYTAEETMVWTTVWERMEPLWEQYACKEYREALQEMQVNCDYRRDNIPQQQTISEYLQSRTGFRMRPVPGLLSSRDFLNGLAFRVFFSTQYMRHHSQPLYTPEPDLCHELLGHAPMLSDADFADFSQEIGLASLGASDDEVVKLARVRRNATPHSSLDYSD